MRDLVHHTLRHVDQLFFRSTLLLFAFFFLLNRLLKLCFQLRIHILQHRNLSLLLTDVRHARGGWLLRLLADPGFSALLDLHGYDTLHGLLHVVLVQVRWDLR